jgi:hypothetical protein
MDDDQLDEPLRTAARDYHPPPATPRDAMWRAIDHQRRADRTRRPAGRPWIPWAAAAAALLTVGAALGRLFAPGIVSPGAEPTPARAGAAQAEAAQATLPRVNQTAYRMAALEHLGQSEAFLTLFRASLRTGGQARLAPATARQLLASNRLLLDSPAARDSRTRLLLEDLELVLAEIAQLPANASPGDRKLIRDGMEQGAVLPRLRTVVPAGSTPTRGDL